MVSNLALGLKVEDTMVIEICKKAKQASYQLVMNDEKTIDDLLFAVAECLQKHWQQIVCANKKDVDKALQNGVSEVMIDRLKLNKNRVFEIANSVRQIAKLENPLAKQLGSWQIPNGVNIKKQAVPFGVVAMIYESRPNVTVDASVIALKTKNAIILKGGKEAIHSNAAFVALLKETCISKGINPDVVGFIHSTERRHAEVLLGAKAYVDLLIPRGSAGLINWVTTNAVVPVIETGAGNCHLFIDESADYNMALNIIDNAKTQRASVCNAIEKVLVHQAIAESFIKTLVTELNDKVKFKVDRSAVKYFEQPDLMTEQERFVEYLDYILGVIVVEDVDAAINWINTYGSHHSDGIITLNDVNAKRFTTVVDSAAVYHNTSTRFTDGGEFGFGAEIGIATSKLHARGPMALSEMTTYKYILSGNGQVR